MQAKISKPVVVLSECTRNYAASLANPFTGPLGCVPIAPTVMSLKIRTWVKGNFATSSTGASPTGFGFINADPYCAATYDTTSVVHSDASFQGTSIPNLATAGTSQHFSNSPYANISFAPTAAGIQYRIVSAGLRIRYTGTELQRGGTIAAFVDPTSNSTIGQDFSTVMAEVTSRKFPVNRSWTTILWRPVLIGDYAFQTDPASHFTNALFGPMCILVQSPSASLASEYEYEFACCYEMNGRFVRGQTSTPVDVNGQNAVASAALKAGGIMPHQSEAESHSRSFLTNVASEVHKFSSYVTDSVTAVESIVGTGAQIFKAGRTISALL